MKAKILIVEDDAHILAGLEEVLKSDGFEAVSCNRGDLALEAAAKHKPALVLLDVMLPGPAATIFANNCAQKSLPRRF